MASNGGGISASATPAGSKVWLKAGEAAEWEKGLLPFFPS
jgi:hypothetical protein